MLIWCAGVQLHHSTEPLWPHLLMRTIRLMSGSAPLAPHRRPWTLPSLQCVRSVQRATCLLLLTHLLVPQQCSRMHVCMPCTISHTHGWVGISCFSAMCQKLMTPFRLWCRSTLAHQRPSGSPRRMSFLWAVLPCWCVPVKLYFKKVQLCVGKVYPNS